MNEDAYRAFEKLSQHEFDDIFIRLLDYTIRVVESKTWNQGVMPAGIEPQDIVRKIIVKTLNGKRKWNPNEVDMFTFMRGQVRSLVSHLFERKEYINERHSYEEEDILETIDLELSLEETLERDIYIDPAVYFESIEEESEREDFVQCYISELLEAVDGKPELEEVLYAIEAGCGEEPRYLAAWLNISVDEINNRLKRLRRRAEKIKQKRMPS